MKKLISFLMIISLLLIVSCGNKDNNSQSDTSSNEKNESSEYSLTNWDESSEHSSIDWDESSEHSSVPSNASSVDTEDISKTPELEITTNIAALGKYTIGGFCEMDIFNNAEIPYPDENGVTLTDGKLPTTKDFTDEALTGFCANEDYKEKGYHYIDFEFDKNYKPNSFKFYVVPSTEENQGLCSPDISIYASDDGENWSIIASATPENKATSGFEDIGMEVIEISVDQPVEAKQFQIRFEIDKGWMFLGEIEIFI